MTRWMPVSTNQESSELRFRGGVTLNCVQPIRLGEITVRSTRFQAIRSDSTRAIFHKCAFVGIWKHTKMLP